MTLAPKQEVDSPPGGIPMVCKITKEQLLWMLNEQFPTAHQIPMNAEVTIKLPSGGDLSGEDFEITRSTPIEVRWVKPA